MGKDELYTNLEHLLNKIINTCFSSLDTSSLDIELSLCKDISHGDFSTNVIFKIAKLFKREPLEVGQEMIKVLEAETSKDKFLKENIKKIELKSPGFINFFVSEDYLYEILISIIFEKDNFGSTDLGKGESVQIEFVSANPTGPLSIAHGRQAAIGDALANIFSFLGYRVTKEYYINDAGVQIENLAKSIWVRFRQRFGEDTELPADGYKGEYIAELAQKISPELKDKYLKWDNQTKEFFISFGCREIMELIKDDLQRFGVEFDNWVSQNELIKSQKIKDEIALLQKRDFIYEKDGALWLRSTLFGDDKDRVVVKSDGSFTYIASDIVYHKDKYAKGFKKIINIWGPDHHGYIPRLRAAVKAMGYNQEQLKILIVQLATLYRDGKVVPMSTRAGSFITLKEVIDEVGKDVARFFFLDRRLDSHLEFDLAIAKKESSENPVYYIQYANARINSLREYAQENNFDIEVIPGKAESIRTVLKNLGEEELVLVRILQQFPYVIIEASRHLEPNILITYLETLAKNFHQYYAKYRIIGSEPDISMARIFMATAIAVIIKNSLRLLGISFPDKM